MHKALIISLAKTHMATSWHPKRLEHVDDIINNAQIIPGLGLQTRVRVGGSG